MTRDEIEEMQEFVDLRDALISALEGPWDYNCLSVVRDASRRFLTLLENLGIDTQETRNELLDQVSIDHVPLRVWFLFSNSPDFEVFQRGPSN